MTPNHAARLGLVVGLALAGALAVVSPPLPFPDARGADCRALGAAVRVCSVAASNRSVPKTSALTNKGSQTLGSACAAVANTVRP